MRPAALAGLSSIAPAFLLAACSDHTGTEPYSPTRADSVPAVSAAPASPEWRASSGPTATGFTVGRNGAPIEVTYEVHNGWAVWEGDIVLGPAGEVPESREALLERFAAAVRPGPEGTQFGVVIDGASFRWAGGVVPYEIEDGLPNQARITNAISMVESSTAGVTLAPRSGEADFVRFVTGDGCFSAIGRQGGMQEIILGNGCTAGNAAHEILHALSMFHEQSRCDRDAFVEILWANIEEGREGNFVRECDGATDIDEYEEGSIMHYGPSFFSATGQPTIVSLRGLDHLMGQRSALSGTDIITINALYAHHNQPPTAVIGPLEDSYPEGSPVSFDGSGSFDPDDEVLLYSWTFGDGTCEADPQPAKCTAQNPLHTYADNADYTVTLMVRDGPEPFDGFLEDETSVVANVHNVAPTVSAGPDLEVVSAELFHFSGTFTDPGLLDAPWTYEIDWGFGDPTLGSTDDQFAPISDSRQICGAGQYQIVLSVTDKDGDTGTDSMELTATHFAISIDIMPGGDPTPVNTRRRGRLPVAILSSPDFDATQVDPSTVTLGDEAGEATPVAQRNNGTYFSSIEDVNGDGLPDLVVAFEVEALVANGDLHGGSTELVLRGFLEDDCTNFRGAAPVVPKP